MILKKFKRPSAQFKPHEFAMIPPRLGQKNPVLRYIILRKRTWIKTDQEWVYDGIVVLTISNDGVIVVRQYARGVSEDKLRKVRGGDLGLPGVPV